MKIFEDVFNGDEVLSDALEIKLDESKSIISVVSKMIVPDDGANVDIGCSSHFGGGDEQAEEGGDDGVEKVNNILENFQLEEYFASKKDMMSIFKDKIAEVKERLKDRPDRLKEWGPDGAVSKFVKGVFSKYDDCKFYMGKSYGSSDPTEGMLIISYWVNDEDSGETFFYFKDCLREVKV